MCFPHLITYFVCLLTQSSSCDEMFTAKGMLKAYSHQQRKNNKQSGEVLVLVRDDIA